jgi:hypothetical protein
MIISIPTKAKENFIQMCVDAKNATNEKEFNYLCNKARGYSAAINDICGLSVWGEIIRCADMEVGSETYPTCAGIPMFFKPELTNT